MRWLTVKEPRLLKTSSSASGRHAIFLAATVVLVLVAIMAGTRSYGIPERTSGKLSPVEAGPVDIGFAQYMSVHHDQAVVMSQILLDDRLLTDPQPSRLKAFALSISTAQLLEIGQMRGWLALWEQPAYPTTESMTWMLLGSEPPDAELSEYLLNCRQSPNGMVGMATDEELDALRRMDRDQRDRRFLELMLKHHRGALPMARFATHHARVPALRALAARIVRDQTLEIAAIERTLAAMDAEKRLN